jgi:hypothetical protein
MTKNLEVAILFADVVGSTQLYDEFGCTTSSAMQKRGRPWPIVSRS